LGFKLKREWFRSIESLLGLRKGVADFITKCISCFGKRMAFFKVQASYGY
jgi:hypothetical protein